MASLHSMTGYGSALLETDTYTSKVELKSVNAKFFDCNLHIPRLLQEKEYEIKTKTESFSMIKLSDYKQTFMELVFVILAAGTSAKLALKTVNILAKDDFVINASLSQIISKLKECYRFYNVRGKYIFNSRNYIKEEYDNNFEKIFSLNRAHYKRRNFFLRVNLFIFGIFKLLFSFSKCIISSFLLFILFIKL
mgnify:CR=1 FL=1